MVPHRDVQVTGGVRKVTLLVHPYEVVRSISTVVKYRKEVNPCVPINLTSETPNVDKTRTTPISQKVVNFR